MKKFELVLLVMLLIHSFSVMIEAKQHVKTKSDWVIQRTPVDPEWLKVYVDDESKRLCLNFKDSFAHIIIEVKDIEKQIVYPSIIFPVAAGEYTLYLGDPAELRDELYMYTTSTAVV
ncbi:hypothetical protein BT_3828 [Bacteroides thetaiotaomicron VPI-5482]|uniref:DUF3244 domain-containing protein n=1 Tax=Bacteroides thetaiotaomicron (strain ATCC 29148 / DSM 2079 / JCM 5827 / CCUG 10774 / NCTC 10582 / VPI-5482 / E50) TaxID=226186 RepID=Q8A141_BACTN|nr:hypothetical protein [Bacteroides thetaiotaomicron]AAO78933.1 hypothetical protein BT_3828 [Bacteroides thetaiotaomicron VPI-5482]